MNAELADLLKLALVCAVALDALRRGYGFYFNTPWGGGGALPPEAKRGRRKPEATDPDRK